MKAGSLWTSPLFMAELTCKARQHLNRLPALILLTGLVASGVGLSHFSQLDERALRAEDCF